MASGTLRRLPGFAFESRAAVYEDVLPRMDVAVFAGFAASGPLNIPVPVEDAAQFAAVFGSDAPLAWDNALGRTVYAQLAPAVRMFFANGGRRCWVIRLAGAAQTNVLPVPGIAAVDSSGACTPMSLIARSPGSWSDSVALSSTLTTRRFGVLGWNPDTFELELLGPADAALQAGDLLRLAWRDEGVVLYLGVEAITVREAERSVRRRVQLHVQGGQAKAFDTLRAPASGTGAALLPSGAVAARLLEDTASPPGTDGTVAISLDLTPTVAPRPGQVITVQFGADELLLSIDEVSVDTDSGSPPLSVVVLRGPGLWVRPGAAAPATLPSVDRLGLDLWARIGSGDVRRVGNLGMAPGHPRHLDRLPVDEAVYGADEWPDVETWRDVITPRFPAAGRGTERLCVPFGAGVLPEHYLSAETPALSALERDGLVPFNAALFADETLAGSLTSTLLTDAEYLRFLSPNPRALTGLHAALAIEEATLIAVPDAAQAGWIADVYDAPPAPEAEQIDVDGPDDDDDFVDCAAVLHPGPVLEGTAQADASIALEWTSDDAAGPFTVQEAANPDWSDAAVVFDGDGPSVTLTARRPGDYYYRVRSTGPHSTEWSNAVSIRVAPGGGWRTLNPREYDDDVLLAVHRLLLRFCAARRDAMAVLSLPEHYSEDAAAAHASVLSSNIAPPVPVGARSSVAALGFGEADAFGFGALYHGWVYTRDAGGTLRTLAPDGAACGTIARRTLARGAWVAPANELFKGVVALVKPTPASRWQELQQLRINVVRQQPRGFAVMSADTLIDDADVRAINVRRLLILLRRLVTRRGALYVFEPNDDSFRRMVQRGFEATLGDLFQRGAFAGRTAAQAFQVVTDESVNTRQSVDAGRFIVELRVAPARPLVFLTIRLVQTGERVAVSGA